MRKHVIFMLSLLLVAGLNAQVDSLNMHYYENYPYAYKEGTTLKGIEIDIMEEYVNWLKQKKNISVKLSHTPYTEFSGFYSSVKDGRAGVVGLGSVTNNGEREKEVLFSPPYLQNVAVLITDGTVPTIKAKNAAEVSRVLGGMSALALNKSSHVNYLNEIKKNYVPALKISYTENKQSNVLDAIVADKKVFGYVDIVAYWAYLKQNPSRFLKMQKPFNEPKEFLGFIMPRNGVHAQYLSEFFESGFGFTSTKVYHQILEKYLGYEIIESVEIK